MSSRSSLDDVPEDYCLGRGESLQVAAPGEVLGSYVEKILLTDPGTDPDRGLYKVRETLKVSRGTLSAA